MFTLRGVSDGKRDKTGLLGMLRPRGRAHGRFFHLSTLSQATGTDTVLPVVMLDGSIVVLMRLCMHFFNNNI